MSHRGILSGIRVLELGRMVAAPTAGQILGDLGADVIKVEQPGSGDNTRTMPPAFARDAETGEQGDSIYFLAFNRNKRSVTVDLSTAPGQQLVRSLASHCDVVLENFKVGTLAAWGLDYASLAVDNPGLVSCSVTGYGQTGPYAERPGLDTIFQAQCGLMSVTGIPDGEPGAGPLGVGVVAIDLLSGYNAAMAILGALLHREHTGQGQELDIALFDSGVAFMSHAAQQFLVTGEPPARQSKDAAMAPSAIFECRDGPIYILATRDHFFASLCKVLGIEHLLNDPRFGDNEHRAKNRRALHGHLAERVKTWPRQALLDALGATNVPAGAVNDMAEVFADPQIRARELARPLPDQRYPDLKVVASPMHFSKTPATYERPPPALGQHTTEVLEELLGLSEDDIESLREQGAI